MYSLKTSQRVLYGDTYLVISLDGKSLIPYQEDMLYENRLTGYLSFYSKFENGLLIYYNITNCVRLSDFIGEHKLSRSQYLMIIDSIIDALILRDQYFLSENSLLIHKDFIFIKDNSEVALVYLPAEVDVDYKLALRDFNSWLTSRLDLSEPGAGDASIPLQLILSNPTCNPGIIKETIAQIQTGVSQEAIPQAPDPLYEPEKPNDMIISEGYTGDTMPQRKRNKDSKNEKKQRVKLFGISLNKKKNNPKPNRTDSKKPKKKQPREPYTEEQSNFPQLNQDYSVYLPNEPNNESGSWFTESSEPRFNENLAGYPADYGSPESYSSISSYKQTDSNKPLDYLGSISDSASGGVYNSGIPEDIQFVVYLLYKHNTPEEQIINVDISPFIIGRDEKSNYLINDVNISREHAMIVLEDNKAYLIDNKSKYGTFVNNTRLHPHTPQEIKDDDIIMFSGFTYNVKIVQIDDLFSIPR